jgi:ubiquinone/menaquinone biosynthesis C-methylase UbiE
MLTKRSGHPLTWVERLGWSIHSRQWDDCLQLQDYQEGMQRVTEWLGARRRPGDSRVVDLGCGTGNYSLALARDGWAVTGVDWAPGMLRRARGKARREGGLRAEFRRGDFNRPLEFEDGAFDHAICIAAMQCVADPAAFLAEVARVTRPGGCFVTVFKDRRLNEMPRRDASGTSQSYVKPSLKWRILTRMKAYARSKPGWVRRYDRDEMARLVEGAGFTGVEVHPFYPNTRALVAQLPAAAG